MSRQWNIGDVVPIEATRDITHGPEIEPVWHALLVPPCREKAASAMLERKGIYSFYPERTVQHRQRGKLIVRKLPIITQIVYAQFRNAPQFDVLKARRIITGVYSIGERPIVIPPDVIRAIQGLPTEAEMLAQARAELLRVREGDKATLVGGPLDGHLVDVKSTAHGRVWFETLTGLKGEVAAAGVKRVLPEK